MYFTTNLLSGGFAACDMYNISHVNSKKSVTLKYVFQGLTAMDCGVCDYPLLQGAFLRGV